jgi:hypothetical protein
LLLNEQEFASDQWERFDDFANHVISPDIPPKMLHLDFFHLSLVIDGSC